MISVIVLTKNVQNLIEACLGSISWADEIIVVDDRSIDDTVKIAKTLIKNVFVHPLKSFADSRNFGLLKAQGDWILYLDSDERVTKQLKDEINEVISDKLQIMSAFAIPRKNILLGKWQKHQDWWPDYQIRLFKKDSFKGYFKDLHEQPKFDGKLGHLKNPLIHLTHRDILSMMQKTISWAPIEARLRKDANHPQMSWWRFVRIVKFETVKRFIKGGFKDGTEGWIEIFYQAFSLFVTYVKLWELQRKESLKETYEKIDEELVKSGFEDKIIK